MEEKKTKGKDRFKLIFNIILIFFAFVYITGKTGYYETHLQKNTQLTNEAIKAFEKDLAEGKAVDIKDYINIDSINYQNRYSKLGLGVSNQIDFVLTEGVGKFVGFLKTLFTG